MKLRDYQLQAACDACHAIEKGRTLIQSPTGTGKSYVALALRKVFQREGTVGLVSPRTEILAGIAEKAGLTTKEMQTEGFWTPVKLRNALRKGMAPYDHLIIDEAHHGTAPTYQLLDLVHLGMPVVGLTATAFRGTPRETKKLREYWTTIVTAITMGDAAKQGFWALPTFHIHPLVDDDVVSIRGGRFVVKSLNEACSRLESLADVIADVWENDGRPTMVSVPSTEILKNLLSELEALQIPAHGVTQKTKRADRDLAFSEVAAGKAVLVQIAIVGEGVDIPTLRVWIDALPTLSPVRWLQALGRVTRPGDEPRVIVCNRNLERHAYLLEGLLPASRFKEAQEAFGGPSQRQGLRHLGLEALGRFKPVPVALANGITTTAYSLYENTDKFREYFALVLPTTDKLLYAFRESAEQNGEMKWGRWAACAVPEGFRGYQSTRAARKVSEPMARWWRKEAKRRGLREDVPEKAREFQVLPVLSNLGVTL